MALLVDKRNSIIYVIYNRYVGCKRIYLKRNLYSYKCTKGINMCHMRMTLNACYIVLFKCSFNNQLLWCFKPDIKMTYFVCLMIFIFLNNLVLISTILNYYLQYFILSRCI